jgi:hypothetical protein
LIIVRDETGGLFWPFSGPIAKMMMAMKMTTIEPVRVSHRGALLP